MGVIITIITTNDLLLSIERIRKPACLYVPPSARSHRVYSLPRARLE